MLSRTKLTTAGDSINTSKLPFPCIQFLTRKLSLFCSVVPTFFIKLSLPPTPSMGILTTTDEFTSTIAAPRLFKALILEADALIPKIVPQAIKNVDILEGNGGPGTIKIINFAQGSEIKSVKHKIEALDEKNLSISYSIIEGEPLFEKLEKISYELSFESIPDGGAKGKNISTYYPKPDAEVTEEEIKEGKEKSALLFKAVEAYLLANPDVYA